MHILRWLLFPITLVYSFIIWTRNVLYDLGVLSSRSFNVPTIVIGNLIIGGSGKSPLTQKLIAHFKDHYQLATLSRGYGRKTKGFRLVHLDDPASQSGDEPLQFKKNHPEITIAVDEQRARGIDILSKDHNLILLDDAFQHRKVKARCHLLLFDYASIIEPLILLPTGNLRDTMNQTKRADIVLITKCPPIISPTSRKIIEDTIRKHNPSCSLYYSRFQYLPLVDLRSGTRLPLEKLASPFILLTGIANPRPLTTYLEQKNRVFQHLSFRDHHDFNETDYRHIRSLSGDSTTGSANLKPILTTEKDAQRLSLNALGDIPVYYIPIDVKVEHEHLFFREIERIIR
ncbi:MAG: tetraacyldisaccharide 4'-kinase [Sphingobacterium sp.]